MHVENSVVFTDERLGSANMNDAEGQHWDDLEKFFNENEKTIQKASEISSFSSKVEDVELTVGIFTDTSRVVLDGLTVLSRVHPVLHSALKGEIH